jgi:hypothetical protein
MTKFALSVAALATAGMLAIAAPVSASSVDTSSSAVRAHAGIQLAQADVQVRVNEPSRTVVKKKVIVRKPVVRKRVVVGTSAPVVTGAAVVTTRSRTCRTVTVHKHVGGRDVVSRVRKCG